MLNRSGVSLTVGHWFLAFDGTVWRCMEHRKPAAGQIDDQFQFLCMKAKYLSVSAGQFHVYRLVDVLSIKLDNNKRNWYTKDGRWSVNHTSDVDLVRCLSK